jgi:tRNA-binding EMAP/Myf-like protein
LGVAKKGDFFTGGIIKLPQCLHLPHLTSEVKVREGPNLDMPPGKVEGAKPTPSAEHAFVVEVHCNPNVFQVLMNRTS